MPFPQPLGAILLYAPVSHPLDALVLDVPFHQPLDAIFLDAAVPYPLDAIFLDAAVPYPLDAVDGGVIMCLSQKFAANRRGDDRYGIELTISAIGVVPSGF